MVKLIIGKSVNSQQAKKLASATTYCDYKPRYDFFNHYHPFPDRHDFFDHKQKYRHHEHDFFDQFHNKVRKGHTIHTQQSTKNGQQVYHDPCDAHYPYPLLEIHLHNLAIKNDYPQTKSKHSQQAKHSNPRI